MFRKTALILVFAVFFIPFSPATGMGWYYRSPGYHHHYPRHYYHGYYGNEALWWGLGGFVLGTIIVASAYQPPPPPREVVYVRPQTPIFAYPPEVPAGMCRWERYVLDDYGRVIMDGYGRPLKQYTLGSCQYPPN